MAPLASVGNLQPLALRGSNEPERMRPDVDVRDGLLDRRHVARHALVPAGISLVMRVRLNRGGARSVRHARSVTLQAHHARRLAQVRVVRGSVDIVATEASHPVRVHRTLHEIVALHAILVGRPVGEMSKRGLAQLVIF